MRETTSGAMTSAVRQSRCGLWHRMPEELVEALRPATLKTDLRRSRHDLIANVFAASDATPRFLRYLLLRAAGVDSRSSNIMPGNHFCQGPISIGKGTFINRDCYFEGSVTIGEKSLIAQRVQIVTSYHPWLADGTFSPTPETRPVAIEPGCWIGAGALILPGVTVGERCVVAAGAVVRTDCQPDSLYGGVPARLIRRLTPDSKRPTE